jgi:hypothetical protein
VVPRAAHSVVPEQPLGERAAVVRAGRADRQHLGAAADEDDRLAAGVPSRGASPRRSPSGMPASRSGPVSLDSCPPMRRRVAGRGAGYKGSKEPAEASLTGARFDGGAPRCARTATTTGCTGLVSSLPRAAAADSSASASSQSSSS